MKQIQKIGIANHNDQNVFLDTLVERIKHLQYLGYEIYIQYSVATLGGEIMYTALLIGRK